MYPTERSSQRVLLREWHPSEAESVHRWLSDPGVNRFLSWGTKTLDESAAHLSQIVEAQRADPRIEYFLALELITSPGTTIGDAGFSWIEVGVAEIGCFLEPAYWGMGYGREVAELVIDLAFELDAQEVIATCDADNWASQAVLSKCGLSARSSCTTGRRTFGIRRDEQTRL